MTHRTPRRLIESTLVSLNGVVTNQAQWASSYFDTEAKQAALAQLNECDVFLLGRKTYEQFAPRWSQIHDDPYFAAINAMPKVVVSNTLASATWNATILRGEVADQVRAFKAQPGKDIIKYGVTELDRSLIANQLIDEFHFSIYPVVVPSGVRLFEGIDTSRMQLELIGSRQRANGVVEVSYRPKYV